MLELHRNRLLGGTLAMAMLAPLLVAAWLTPASGGTGTHEQLGLPPCGFLAVTGRPCATCGMTTAFAHAAHGRPITALLTQPAGALLCLACAMFMLAGLWSAISGMPLGPLLAALGRRRYVFGSLGVVLASWLYTIWTHAG